MRYALPIIALVISLGFETALPGPAEAWCGPRGCYRNRPYHHLVPRPFGNWRWEGAHPSATALCRDGANSFSEHPYAPGTCSHHGGVEQFAGPTGGSALYSITPRSVPRTLEDTNNFCGSGFRMGPGGCQPVGRR
jgi:hypothetical protein